MHCDQRFSLLPIVGACLFLGAQTATHSADWPQWRGPTRDGVAPDSPPLAEAWPNEGPAKLWQSEAVPSGEDGNLSSPIVAGGKVFIHVNWRYRESLVTRTLADVGLRNLGWRPEKIPDELSKRIEEARLSEERDRLGGAELSKWVDAWVAEHLVTDEQKKLTNVVKERLNSGKDALAVDVLNKLSTIKDRTFATKEEIDKWLAENGIDGDLKKKIDGQIPITCDLADDVVMCFSAADGKTLWKVKLPGTACGWAANSTPCVSGNRLYVHGSRKNVYCLDVDKGGVVWKNQLSPGNDISSSFLVEDGLAVVSAGCLTAFDARTGEIKWKMGGAVSTAASPHIWKIGDRKCVICNGNIACVDLKTGEMLWMVPESGGGNSTTVLKDDLLVVFGERKEAGITCYKLTAEKAEKAWTVALWDRGSSPIISGGYVYAIGGGGAARTVCVDLKTGQLAWDEKIGFQEISSPILADGKMFALVDNYGALAMWKAVPAKSGWLGKFKLTDMAPCTSPAFVDGKIFLRLKNAIACYDLTAKPAAAQ